MDIFVTSEDGTTSAELSGLIASKGRHDVNTGASAVLSSGVRAIMPLSMARFDFLSFWADEALLPSYSRVTTCFDKGWIRGGGKSVIIVG